MRDHGPVRSRIPSIVALGLVALAGCSTPAPPPPAPPPKPTPKPADDDPFAAGDLAFAHALVTYTGLSAEGKALRAMTNRISWVLRRSGGAWRVIHEHSSAPVDFETQKAILQAP